jgi:hypothetical protein
MEPEYWTPEDFVEGLCAAEDIGKEKPPDFDDSVIDLTPAVDDDEQDVESTPRRRGRPPNMTARARSVQESLRLAFHGLGGVEGLIKWGRTHPTEFYRLCGRLVPQEIKAAFDLREVRIIHALAPTALDWHPDKNGVLQPPRTVDDLPTSHLLSTDCKGCAEPE